MSKNTYISSDNRIKELHGDSLLVKEYARFYTPLYSMNGWL